MTAPPGAADQEKWKHTAITDTVQNLYSANAIAEKNWQKGWERDWLCER